MCVSGDESCRKVFSLQENNNITNSWRLSSGEGDLVVMSLPENGLFGIVEFLGGLVRLYILTGWKMNSGTQ